MTIRRTALTVLLLIVAIGACGSDSSAGGTGTELEIEGIATTGFVAPDPTGTSPSIPSNGEVIEIDISGTLTCDGDNASGTGMYAASAPDLCPQVVSQLAVFDEIAAADGDVACAQIYGGPQHVSIKGTVDGSPVDIDIARDDGCGIENWQRLEWLIGPPER